MDATTRPRRRLESSWEWLEFAANLPYDAEPINLTLGNQLVIGGRNIFCGASVNNTATTALSVLFRDGTDNTGKFVAGLAVPASSTASLSLPSKGILLEIGLFVAFTAGTGAAAAYVIPLWHYPATPPGE